MPTSTAGFNLIGQDVFSLALTRTAIKSAIGDLSEKTSAAINEAIEESVNKAKEYIQQELANVTSFETKVVNVLPEIEDAQPSTIYFVPKNLNDPNNFAHWEYIFIDGRWELIGNTEFNIEDYATKEQVREYINEATYSLLPATDTRLGGVKVDPNTISLEDDGTISINTVTSPQINSLF